jgi:hypothetical protein
MQNYQIAMVKELSIVLGINHQELPEHPSDQNKGLSVHQRRLFSKIVTAICTYLESNITIQYPKNLSGTERRLIYLAGFPYTKSSNS